MKQFVPDRVIETILDVFWKSGYDGTSISQIVAATGLSTSSLYSTFGDKRKLFEAALDSYHKHIFKALNSELEGVSDPFERILTFIDWFRDNPSPAPGKGCLFTKLIIEKTYLDDDFGLHARRVLSDVRHCIESLLLQAKKAGCFADDFSVDHWVWFVCATLNGVSVCKAAGGEVQDIEKILGVLKSQLQLQLTDVDAAC